MNRRTSPESLAKLLCIAGSRSLEAVLKAQLIAAVAHEIELRGLTHAEGAYNGANGQDPEQGRDL